MKRKNVDENSVKKKRKINFLDILTFVCIIVLLALYVPRAISLYIERKEYLKEANKPKVIEYPLEVNITDDDTKFFGEFLDDYAIGINADVDFSDGISETEMIDFTRAILSEKYSSSGVISKSSMDSMLKKYFEVEGVNYTSLGYKSLSVIKDIKVQNIYNITKIMQFEENSDIYLIYIDEVSKENVKDGIYQKENIQNKYVFTMKKIVNEQKDDVGNITSKNVKYVLQKVETEVIETEVEEVETTTNSKK